MSRVKGSPVHSQQKMAGAGDPPSLDSPSRQGTTQKTQWDKKRNLGENHNKERSTPMDGRAIDPLPQAHRL